MDCCVNRATPDVLTVPRRQAKEGHRRSQDLLVSLRAFLRVQKLRRPLGRLILEHELLVVENLLVILLNEFRGRVDRAEATTRQQVVQHQRVTSPGRQEQPSNSSERCVTSNASDSDTRKVPRANLENFRGLQPPDE